MKRTLLRHQDHLRLPTKKNRVGAHKITEPPKTALRRSTPEMRGTKSFFRSIELPKSLWNDMKDGVLYDVRYHFTKGFRVNAARS
jgi:hypothetical protein